MTARLPAAAARRVALAAQGLAEPRPSGRVDRGRVRRLVRRLGLLQLDSVNVVVRAHYLPLFSRLGPYDRAVLDRIAWRDHELVESWAHVASLIPVEDSPLLRWRSAWLAERYPYPDPAYLDAVYAEVAARGPLTAAELPDPGDRSGPWWGWNRGKEALEHLFWHGRLAATRRPGSFERRYDLPERLLPAAVLAAPTPDRREAHRELLLRAARALGVGTAADLADYYRLKVTEARPLLDGLVAEGALEKVAVDGWPQPAYLDPAARMPRTVRARALLAPFDPVVWERARTERMFGFRYRIEIYTPAPKRTYGYYVLPFLLGDRLVARVDVKADRAAGVLRVPGAFAEDGVDPREVAGELREELAEMARWLGLGEVAYGDRGDLARHL